MFTLYGERQLLSSKRDSESNSSGIVVHLPVHCSMQYVRLFTLSFIVSLSHAAKQAQDGTLRFPYFPLNSKLLLIFVKIVGPRLCELASAVRSSQAIQSLPFPYLFKLCLLS